MLANMGSPSIMLAASGQIIFFSQGEMDNLMVIYSSHQSVSLVLILMLIFFSS